MGNLLHQELLQPGDQNINRFVNDISSSSRDMAFHLLTNRSTLGQSCKYGRVNHQQQPDKLSRSMGTTINQTIQRQPAVSNNFLLWPGVSDRLALIADEHTRDNGSTGRQFRPPYRLLLHRAALVAIMPPPHYCHFQILTRLTKESLQVGLSVKFSPYSASTISSNPLDEFPGYAQ